MANYISTYRSSYFRVKDVSKFIEWCDGLHLRYIEEVDKSGNILSGFTQSDFEDDGGLPSFRYSDEEGDWEEVDMVSELADHLLDEEVAIIMESGAEKLRYVMGLAWAVNSKGEIVQVSLHDIYEMANQLGKNYTACEY